jgi:filamentous hemagglutinin family protein
MNHIYRSIWNHSTATYVAAAETAKSGGKKVSSSTGSLQAGGWALKALAASLCLAYAGGASALPQGGVVTAGSASVTATPGKVTIVQGSQSAALNWQSFSIGASEAVQFVQPSSSAVALNRVVGTDPSAILGSLSANGKVFLVNSNGILFGKGASVNVGGLVASTLNITDSDFMAGRYKFSGSSTKAVSNQGTINAPGGYVAMLGAHVSNEGVIAARMGSVSLAGGQAITLDVAGDGLLHINIDQGAVDALVSNGGLIQADGGQVLMTAQAAGKLLKTVVNNTGVIRAQTLVNHNGSIKLLGDMQSGTVNAAGTLDASAPAGGNGGFIETSAAHVKIDDALKVTTAASANGLTGSWLIDPTNYTIAATGGDQTGAFYTNALQTSNVSIATVATGAGLGDINVNDTISWSANKLTLTAHNDININAPLRGSGTASLALEYGQGAVASGNTATYNVKAQIDLPSGQNFSTRLGSDTALPTVYTVINNLGDQASISGIDLQGMRGNLGGNYVLGSNIDASLTAGWNSDTGFTPIGDAISPFGGVFDGLGHTVSDLTLRLILGSDKVSGLFGSTSSTARIQNIGLVNVKSFTSGWGNEGRVGALVGINRGAINNSYATGTLVGNTNLGGLVGLNESPGTINNSYFSGSVTAGNRLGGLVGVNKGRITNSYSTGQVRSSVQQDLIGGLVGHNDGGTVSTSYASADVSNADPSSMGSLVGKNDGSVTNSYWNLDVSTLPGIAGSTTTGATGLTSAQMKQQANFVGWDFADTWLSQAGLVDPLLRAFMAPLTVKANDATRTYNGTSYDGAGGVSYSSQPNASLLGKVNYGSMSQNPLGAGSYTLTPGGLYSAQQGYIISYASGTLTVNPASVNLSAARAYDATTSFAASTFSSNGAIKTGVGTETLILSGAGTVASANVSAGVQALNLDTLALADGSGLASNYTFTGGTHTGEIAPKLLTALVSAPDKTYDGSTLAAPTLTITGGLVGAETISATGVASFNSKDVANANLVTVNSIALADGSNSGLASNYTMVSGQSVAARISPKLLAVGGMTAANKVYDGNLAATLIGGNLTGLVGGETLVFSGQSGTFADKNVGASKAVTVTGIMLANGTGLSSNYSISNPSGLTADITRLASVTWVGPATGNWFVAANWAGGAVPDLANVANVIIPGGVIVSFDNANAVPPVLAATVNVDSIGNAGGMRLAGGSLNVANGLQLTSLDQSGGTLNSGTIDVGSFSQSGGSLVSRGSFTVRNGFGQSGINGTVNAGANIDVTQTGGSALLGNITTAGTLGIHAVTGDINQLAGTSIVTTGSSTISAPNGKVTLANSGNRLGSAISGANITRFQNAVASAISLSVHKGSDGENEEINVDPSALGKSAELNFTVGGTGIKLPPGAHPNNVNDTEIK